MKTQKLRENEPFKGSKIHTKLVMQRNFGRNSGFKLFSAETEIKECFVRNYLNFRAFNLPLRSSEQAAFGKAEKLQVVSRTKTTA